MSDMTKEDEGVNEPTFRRPDERKQQAADPYADQRAYFAHWEAKRLTDEAKKRREWASLSVYERARRNYNG
jgi:hypothetical protein